MRKNKKRQAETGTKCSYKKKDVYFSLFIKSLLVLQNFSTARKSGNISHILKAFFRPLTSVGRKKISVCEKCCRLFVL